MTELSAEQVMGRQVKRLREIRGWSQRELAERMKAQGYAWQQTTAAKTEAADRPIRVNEARSLAHLLEVPIANLLSEPGEGDDLGQLTLHVGELQARLASAREDLSKAEKARDAAREAVDRIAAELVVATTALCARQS